MFYLSYKMRTTYGRSVPRFVGAVKRPTACATASSVPRPDAPAGSTRLNPRPSRAVNDYDSSGMIIYWIWLKSYINRT